MIRLYHITNLKNLQSIAANGLNAGSYWSETLDLAAYYEETIMDDGQTPLVVTLSLDDLKDSELEPDYPGIEEPISTVLGLTEEEVWHKWDTTKQTWQDSLNLVHSIRVKTTIPPELLTVEDPFGDTHGIKEYSLLLNDDDAVSKTRHIR